MTDDEVKQWLSEEERNEWKPTMGGDHDVRPLLRTLAETRKALATHEWGDLNRGRCVMCGLLGPGRRGNAESHAPTCIFATMPRPR